MEFATGAMSSLIPKLGELVIQEYNLKESVKKGIEDLKAELECMQGALVKVSSVPLDQLDPQVKIWANELRELSYAIEDSLDSFVTRVEGVDPTKPKIKHLLKKARNKFTKFSARHEIAGDIKDLESQVMKIKERYERYKINDIIANPELTTVDPRLSALYNKVSDLVGTDEPIDELMKILSEGAEASPKNLKIVSIVGFGGLGKTTLAKALYDKVSKTYECQGFVPVGQNQSVKKVLSDILFELDMKLHKAAERMDERQLINQLQKVLAGKRYFMVIDDLWDIRTWEMIKCVFVDSHPESKIILTTRIVDVAKKANSIYHMKPLSDDNSRLLFYTRTCGDEEVSRRNQPDEVTKKILKKCGGVPLAIITIASLLVSKVRADWSKVYDGIGFGDEDSEVIQNSRKILSFSYYDLRPYLKTCLLYLGMYPEDKFIQKKSLIWRWVSEGFVSDKHGTCSYELGESYYNELVNKSLIREDSPYGEKGCRVHDMVLDLIRTMSTEVNFVTIQDIGENQITSSPNGQSNRVHRLALHGAKVVYNPSIKMGHVRSFNAITCKDSGMPPLSVFKVLRVLVIDECDFLEGHSLEHLGKVVQLRYLGLVKTAVKLPEGIGHDLKFLEILDVRGGLISELPPSVGELNSLRCLWADEGTMMKGEIGKLTCLEELQLHSVDKCPNFCTQVGKLIKLRVIKISFLETEESFCKALVESLCNLGKMHSLEVRHCGVGKYLAVPGGSLEDLAPSSKLGLFTVSSIIILKIPSWINSSRVPLLSDLSLHVDVINAQDIETLGRLPSLLYLVLTTDDNKKCISYSFGSHEFHRIRWLKTMMIEMTIREGALPMLERLSYSSSVRRKDEESLVPWKNCPLIREVGCLVDFSNSGYDEALEAEASLKQAAISHPKRPRLMIHIKNFNDETFEFIDKLERIARSLERPEEVHLAADEGELRDMVTSLETFLHDTAEPQVGRFGEQEIQGIVTKIKSWLQDHAGTDQEEDGWIFKPSTVLLSPIGKIVNSALVRRFIYPLVSKKS